MGEALKDHKMRYDLAGKSDTHVEIIVEKG
jgi:hypothetical protein